MARSALGRARPGMPARGRPWRKRNAHPTALPLPADRVARVLSACERAGSLGDAAAVVEAVGQCSRNSVPPPAWVVHQLESWLAEFVAAGTRRRARKLLLREPRFSPWNRDYIRALRDRLLDAHVQSHHEIYGLTLREAYDEASCYFRGTELTGEPDAIKKACARARRRERSGWYCRPFSQWELQLAEVLCPTPGAGSPRRHWWVINAARMGNERGEWRQRPELLSQLSPHELEAKATATKRRVVPKTHRNGLHT